MASELQQGPAGPVQQEVSSRYRFLATHFAAGNASISQKLLYGFSESLSAPGLHSLRPQSTVTFDMYARKVIIEIYCDRCAPGRRDSMNVDWGTSKSSMWPFKAEIPWEDLQTRGMRLDLTGDHVEGDACIGIYNLRINLRRPPALTYTYPAKPSAGRNHGQEPRVYDRRATEEDFIAVDAGASWGQGHHPNGSEGDGRQITVLGLSTSIAFFKPGNWLSYQISLKLDQNDVDKLEGLLKRLRLTSPFPTSYADPATLNIPDSMPMPSNPQSLLSSIERYPFPMRYLFEGLLSQGVVAPEDLTILIGQLRAVPEESEDKREKLLVSLFSMGPISGRIQAVIEDVRKKLAASGPTKPLRQHVVLIRRAIVTPTRLLLRPPAEETSNHVLRAYGDRIDRFLRVQFTDENDSIFYQHKWDDTGRSRFANQNDRSQKRCPGYGMVGRMRRVMDHGLKFAGRSWTYLAAGGSQLKQHQVWFVCEDESTDFTAQKIRDWMGDFTKEKSIAKHCARISQSFSTTREVKVKLAIKRESDIRSGDYIFTDGVGRTSQALVNKAAHTLLGDAALLTKYSAVQIRIGGAKGMLAAWPSMSRNEVVLRHSMLKYKSEHEKFGAVMVSTYSPAYLNRQAILLMDALGTKQDSLLAAFERQLAQVQRLHERAALSTQRSHDFEVTHFPIQKLFAAGLGSDAFVRDSVELLQTTLLWELKWKARIRVDKGVYLFGIADELGVLGEDEVFCAYNDPNDLARRGVVEGDCIITRAPALHPGDVRRVRAIPHPALIQAGLVNVIVFSVRGERDLANKLAGGDLDGDTFTLVWDPDLLIARNEPPSDYTALHQPRLVKQVELSHIKEWFIDYFKSDVVGQISVAHMAIADQKDPRCDECIRLARLASDAVDFQKTGVPVSMPSDLRQMARRRPDFMGGGRTPEETYESPGILGKMFRTVKNEPSFERHTDIRLHPVLGALRVPSSFLVFAWVLKLEYELDMVGFMRQYMLSEIEVVTGLIAGVAVAPERRKNMMKDDALKLSIRDAFQVKLLEVYQREAAEWAKAQVVPPSFQSATECFAVAAYQLCYDPAARERAEFEQDDITVLGDGIGQSTRPNADGSPADDLYSFCWLWADELADALFRRVPSPDHGASKKRNRADSSQTPEDDSNGPSGFVDVPERWRKKRALAEKREGGWVNVDEDSEDEATGNSLAPPAAGALHFFDEDGSSTVEYQQDIIELDMSDEEDASALPAPSDSPQGVWINDDGSENEETEPRDQAAGRAPHVWTIDESDDDDEPPAHQALPASGRSTSYAPGATSVANSDDLEIYRSTDWRSPAPQRRKLPDDLPQESTTLNYGELLQTADTAVSPTDDDDDDEPALPASPTSNPSPLSYRRSTTPPVAARVANMFDSDEELYGESATNNDVWVNDEMTDEE